MIARDNHKIDNDTMDFDLVELLLIKLFPSKARRGFTRDTPKINFHNVKICEKNVAKYQL